MYPGLSKGYDTLFDLMPDIKDATVLDLACGDGAFSRKCLTKGVASVDGYDISSMMIDKAIKDANNEHRLVFKVADIEKLDLPVNRYNVVHSQFGLHYVSDLPSMMNRIAKSLKPGGIFVATSYINSCIDSGLILEKFLEWGPDIGTKVTPYAVMIRARKSNN
ncbi:hypothetical protein SAMD00019534_112620 [Acytostelium subglobosum LB1]|uniref:hypothetical protein n=1 Tax=Acytostelium subglobosum LB1 TaxID=1410327 RepID=UPI000644B660|nr:hypothetical protein SAMD00019534_112620 [Acytostelium subglobosum LB1]GAM28086.1 hypothetical protein SAMD00019534_112620 [Acytostelium subglobosum LB1]|eukprot:XP_012749045.1 hypothetical protein SAMD00019534_112620 [Acytostelium subglobosum LB1]